MMPGVSLTNEVYGLLDALPDCMAILDSHQNILFLNAAWCSVQESYKQDAAFRVGMRYEACSHVLLGSGFSDGEVIRSALSGQTAEHRHAEGTPKDPRWVRTRAIPWLRQPGETCVLISKQDITADVNIEQSLSSYHDILLAIGAAAECFLGSGRLAEQVDHVLRLLGEATKVSRVYIFDMQPMSDGDWLCSQRYEWCAKGVSPQIDNPELQNLPFAAAGLQRWNSALVQGQSIYGLVETMPESERALLEPQGIVSIVVLPIEVAGKLWGFMGFDECTIRRTWSIPEVEALRAGTRLLGTAIASEQTHALAQEGVAQRELIRQQEELLRELAAPLIPVTDEVVVMPLLGTMDQTRLDQVMQNLLQGVTALRARRAILDVTGVRRMDATAAGGLIRIARAAQLLGVEVMLTGVRAEMARTLVSTGAELSQLCIESSLQAGIAKAILEARDAVQRRKSIR